MALPVLLGPAAQVPPADEAGLIVVRAEIDRARVRYFDGDDGDARFQKLGGDHRGDALVSLEFEDQIHMFLHQQIGVAQGFLHTVAVVDHDEVDAFPGGGALQAFVHPAGKLGIRLGGEAETEAAAGGGRERAAVDSPGGPLQQPSVHQALEQAKRRGATKRCAAHHVRKEQFFAFMAEGFDDLARADYGLHGGGAFGGQIPHRGPF